MAEVVKLVCDQCGSHEVVTRFWVSNDRRGRGKAVQVDLCAEHGTELDRLMSSGVNAPSPKKSRPTTVRRQTPGSVIRTQEEIDAIEAEARKK